MALSPGVRLGPSEILSVLGAGGMGEVYRARDTRLDRILAVKILPETLAADPRFRERFDREARTISQLTHPNICTLYDVGEQQGTAFLVMEYLEGETLADRLTKGALPLDEARKVAIQIADALSTAHRRGIVHRDLKPSNVMLTKTGAKLLDFGLAKSGTPAVATAHLSMLPTTPPLTQQGTILGTFQYMAPEQRAQSRTPQIVVDPRAERLAEMEKRPDAVPQIPEAAESVAQRRELGRPIDMWVQVSHAAGALEQAGEFGRVLGADRAQGVLRALQVRGERHLPFVARIPVRGEGLERAQCHVRDDAQLFVQAKEWTAGQPMDTPVHEVGPAMPGGADAAQGQIVLDDRDVEATCARIAPGRQTRQTATDDDQLGSLMARPPASRLPPSDDLERR